LPDRITPHASNQAKDACGVIQHITPLTTLQTRILNLLGLSAAVYARLEKIEESHFIFSKWTVYVCEKKILKPPWI